MKTNIRSKQVAQGNIRSPESQEVQSLDKREVHVVRIFTLYGHGGHLGHMTLDFFYTRIGSTFPLSYKFGFDCPSGFRGDVGIWLYIATGVGGR